jgi:hypothetical protein
MQAYAQQLVESVSAFRLEDTPAATLEPTRAPASRPARPLGLGRIALPAE